MSRKLATGHRDLICHMAGTWTQKYHSCICPCFQWLTRAFRQKMVMCVLGLPVQGLPSHCGTIVDGKK